MTKLLALDSSTEACSVALYIDGECHEQFALTPREHTKRLLPMVDEVMAQADIKLHHLDAIAFAAGPGSFTGLRICLGAVQGLAFGAGLPVVSVSSLAALSQTALLKGKVDEHQLVMSTIDARMQEIYWAVYGFEEGLASVVQADSLDAPHLIAFEPGRDWSGVGSGMDYQKDMQLQHPFSSIDASLLPGAEAVALLAARSFEKGDLLSAEEAVPVYLRDEVAWQKQV